MSEEPKIRYLRGFCGVCDECLDGAEGVCETWGCAYHSTGTPRPGISIREACEKGGIEILDHPTWCANCNEARRKREAEKDGDKESLHSP